MAVVLPWIKKARDRKRSKEARLQNTKEENELLDLAVRRFNIARAHKNTPDGKDLHEHWRELDRIYRGNQWKGTEPEYKSTPVLNFTFSLVESVIPRLTDSAPEILILARQDERDARLAKELTTTHSYLWQANRMRKKLAEAARMCMKYGTAIFKVLWDPDFHDTDVGDVRYSIVHPINFFPDPRAYEIEQMEYCFVAVPKPMEYFHRRWPDKGPYVLPDTSWTEIERIEGSDEISEEEAATHYEYYFRDENGDLCVMWYAGGVVLDVVGGKHDADPQARRNPEPLFKHNRFPFAKWVDYPLEKEFWGIGEVELIQLLQRLINEFEAQIIDNTRLMSNAQWVVNKLLSGLKEEDAWVFNSRPGNVIWTYNDGVRKESGTPIPAHIPQHQERLIFAMEQILGIHDVVQGRRPVGVRAASAIIALQESANTRVRQKAKNLQEALTEIVEMANWLILDNYDEPRRVRVGGMSTPVTLNIREALTRRLIDQAALQGLMQQGITPDQLLPEQRDMLLQEIKFPELDIEVKVGPSVPYSQALLFEQAKEFYQLGIIDRQAVLELTNFPNREQILARMEAGMTTAEAAGEGEQVGERTI